MPYLCLLIERIKNNDFSAVNELLENPYPKEVNDIYYRINVIAYKLDEIGNLNPKLRS